MWGSPAPGDWVRVTRTVPVSITDHLTNSGLRPGTLGLVIARTGSRLQVRWDAGWGTTTATVSVRDCRLHSRGRGEEAFGRRTRVMTTVRLALALFLIWPFVQFTLIYLWTYRTADGLPPALAIGTVNGVMDFVALAFAHPVQSLVYAVFLSVLSRFAFQR